MDFNTLGQIIKQFGAKVWGLATAPDASGKSPMERIVAYIKDEARKLGAALTSEHIKIALSYEEHSVATLTFDEFLKRIKSVYSLSPGDRICVLKTVKNDVTLLDVMLVDPNDDVSFSAANPWCRFIVANLDIDMKKMFNNKDMLVLK